MDWQSIKTPLSGRFYFLNHNQSRLHDNTASVLQNTKTRREVAQDHEKTPELTFSLLEQENSHWESAE